MAKSKNMFREVLDRCWDILDVASASLLKLRLLTACYGEVFDEPLADEAVLLLLLGIPFRSLLNKKKLLLSFRVWSITLIRGSMLTNKRFHNIW